MKLNDKELIGQPGIDTDFERKQLEYRPNLKWQRPELHSEWGNLLPKSPKDVLDEFIKPSVGELWDNFVSITDQLKELDEVLSKQLKDTDAPIPEQLQRDLQRAALKFGWVIEDKIPFDLYQFALQSKDSLEKQLILDVYEGHHADVEGVLLAELYPDVTEMQQDWGDMFSFLNKGVFAQLIDAEYLPKDVANTDTVMRLIISEEEMMGDYYKSLSNAIDIATEQLRRAFLNSEPETELYALQRELNKKQQMFADIERRMHTKKQAVELLQSKANRALRNIELLRFAANVDHYKGERKQILVSLLKQYVTRQEMDKGLRKIQALLKLSVDGKNSAVMDTKTNLRNLSGRENRKRINSALVSGIHLRNDVSGEVLDVMSSIEDNLDSSGFNRVADHIMDSVSASRDLFKDNTGDFYKMHTMESELRSDKVSHLIDKDSAREIYKLLSNLIQYGKERNSWPTERELTSWVDNFLANQKLS